MLVMRKIEDPANPLGELVSSQRIALRLHYFALGVYPLGFYGVKPRALLGQKATYDPHSFSTLLDFSIVRSQPAPVPLHQGRRPRHRPPAVRGRARVPLDDPSALHAEAGQPQPGHHQPDLRPGRRGDGLGDAAGVTAWPAIAPGGLVRG